MSSATTTGAPFPYAYCEVNAANLSVSGRGDSFTGEGLFRAGVPFVKFVGLIATSLLDISLSSSESIGIGGSSKLLSTSCVRVGRCCTPTGRLNVVPGGAIAEARPLGRWNIGRCDRGEGEEGGGEDRGTCTLGELNGCVGCVKCLGVEKPDCSSDMRREKGRSGGGL